MNQRALIVAVVLFVVIVGSMFGYAYMKSSKLRTVELEPTGTGTAKPVATTHIDAKHFFKDGTHTVAGEIMMPTPCDLLESKATVRESTPEQVTIELTVINNTEGVCAQISTPQRFKVSFKASEGARIEATFNGKPVVLNLVEAGPDENPDNFEVFIKG